MEQTNLWNTRDAALSYLGSERASRVEVIEDYFAAIDQAIDAYEARADSNTFARVCGLTLLKAKNLAIGNYSLILDGLAQESGALARPFIEYTELLTFFRTYPDMVDRALENGLPSAGQRARAIQGMYQNLRGYLNDHASHSSYSQSSLAHLQEPGTGKFKKLQTMVPHVLDRNIRDMTIQMFFLLREAVLGLEQIDATSFDQLAAIADDLKPRLISEFELTPE